MTALVKLRFSVKCLWMLCVLQE